MNLDEKKIVDPASDQPVDYAVELEREKKAREEKEKELSQARHVIETLKKEKKERPAANDDDKPTVDTDELIRQAKEEVSREVEKLKLEQSQDTLEEILKSASNDPKEQELIKFHYENSIVRKGFSRSAIIEDIENAKILANKAKYSKIISEVGKSQVAQATRSGGSSSGQPVESSDEGLADGEKAWVTSMVNQGFKREDVVKQLLQNKKPTY
jgi:hypothetical protein